MLDARAAIGTRDILFVTLDTLRYDVAQTAVERDELPALRPYLPADGWERRHSPGSFTYAAHHAFFAGFLPTPVAPGPHPRLFAARFPGSETTDARTAAFDAPDLVAGLRGCGYRTICIGGVGFFNRRSPLGSVLPDLFCEAHWDESFGVTDRASTEHQVACALERVTACAPDQRVFLFVNVSALHQPNCIYLPGAERDDPESQRAALRAVDAPLGRLIAALRARGPLLGVLTSDHGTAYGEDGYVGHRLAHDVVWTVPYAEFLAEGTPS